MADPLLDNPASPPAAATAPSGAAPPPVAAPATSSSDSAVAPPANQTAGPAAPVAAPDAAAAAPQPAAASTPELSLLGQFDQQKADEAKKAAKKAAEKPTDASDALVGDKAVETKPETKAAEPEKKPDEAKPETAEAKPPEPAKPEPVEYKYTLPDTLKMDEARKAEVHAVLDEFRANPAEGAQKLIDLHYKAMTEYAADYDKMCRDHFNTVKAENRKLVMASEDLGGAGHLTAMGAIARARDALISDAPRGSKQYEADAKAFADLDAVTGLGDNLTFLRIMRRAARYLDEPQASEVPTDIRPPKNNGRPNGKAGLYTHPSSQNMDK